MAKESLYTPQKSPVFRDTFTDEQTTRLFGGVINNVTYFNGTVAINSATSYIRYPYTMSGKSGYSLRLILRNVQQNNSRIFSVTTDGSNTFNLYGTAGSNVLVASQGTVYVDGVQTTSFSGTGRIEVCVTGLNLSNAYNIIVGNLLALNFGMTGVVFELAEIYDYTLTANEVANLYINERYNQLQYASGVLEILNIDGKNGVIANKWNTTLTNTAVTPKRMGDIWAMDFNGTTSRLDCGAYNTLVGDKSFVAWINSEKISSSSLEFIFNNGSVLIAIDNGTWYVSNGIIVSSDGGFSAPTAISASNIVKRMTPFQLAVTRTSAGVVNIYVNGVLTGSANQSSGTPVAGSTNITLGASSVGSNPLDGTLSAVRIIDGILTAQEVSQLFSAERKNYNV